jgi:hypothetical protein
VNGNLVLGASEDISLGLREQPIGPATTRIPDLDQSYADTGLRVRSGSGSKNASWHARDVHSRRFILVGISWTIGCARSYQIHLLPV